ncbi:hypothetical protein ZIOFF_009408 [Zingiber officinale]|uniref:Uncharacterized protein n=1 Tax=Zingiber officinale TaxID=94328 RepID=A0A8J5HKY7_ZINOF|nr:hypothetical protein ZIOFF_009408 [Zingiber officinale]
MNSQGSQVKGGGGGGSGNDGNGIGGGSICGVGGFWGFRGFGALKASREAVVITLVGVAVATVVLLVAAQLVETVTLGASDC